MSMTKVALIAAGIAIVAIYLSNTNSTVAKLTKNPAAGSLS